MKSIDSSSCKAVGFPAGSAPALCLCTLALLDLDVLKSVHHLVLLCRRHPPLPCPQDAAISGSKARELYLNVVQMMRTIYHECRLVHADLSEFNML